MNTRLRARAAAAAATLFVTSLAMLVLGVGRGDRATLEDAATSRPVTTAPATSAVVNEPDPLAPAAAPSEDATGALDPAAGTSTGGVSAAVTPAKEAVTATTNAASAPARAAGGTTGKSSTTARPAKHKTGRSVEGTDNGGSFTYAEDGKHSGASSISSDGTVDPLWFTASVGAGDDGIANIRMFITNNNGDRIEFPDGLRVTLTLVHRESGHRRTVTLEAPEITGLNDGGSVDIAGSAGLDRYGDYDYSASTLVDFGA